MSYSIPPATHLPPAYSSATFLQKVTYWISTVLGTGHLPASGTWGALVAWILHVFCYPDFFTSENWLWALVTVILIILIGIGCGELTERMTGVKDDSRVNIDEVAGYYVTVLFLPAGIWYTAPAFILCRIFDVIKPPPARQLQSVQGGLGIMIDDVIASIYACLMMHGLIYFGWPFRTIS